MKLMHRICCILLVLVLTMSMAACRQTTNDPTEPSLSPEEQILADRRDTVEQYMRKNASVIWRAKEDMSYEIEGKVYKIQEGCLYQGVPYTYAGGTMESFLEFAGEPDEKGIYTVSGLESEALSNSGDIARIGNDCSSAVILAWSRIGANVTGIRTKQMTPKNGFIPVGDYEVDREIEEFVNTKTIILENGEETIYKAYAQTQKGDCLVFRSGYGHALMVVSVDVVYDADGNIDGDKSKVTILEQSRGHIQKNASYEHETLGETVYVIGGVDIKYSFSVLAKQGYIPVTCKELIDPAPVEEPVVTDSETVFNKDTILAGEISSNWFIDAATLTITDSEGAVVQKATASCTRYNKYVSFELQKFVADTPSSVIGSIDLDSLPAGNYHCTLVCRLTTGKEFTVRDFDFTV